MGCILLITGSFWQHWVINIWWTVIIITVSYLMVSTFPYPKTKHLTAYPPIVWVGLVVVALVCWLLAGWEAVPFGLFLLYALSGPARYIYFLARPRLSQS